MLVSNSGLTAFVKHQVNWLNRFCILHSGKEYKKQRPHDHLHFCPLPQQKPSDAPSLFIENICLQDI
jgi:hypothetical protein